MDATLDTPYGLKDKDVTISSIFEKLFSIKEKNVKTIEETLTCDLSQSKKIYRELLEEIMEEIHKKVENGSSNLKNLGFNTTKDERRMCFDLDNPIIKKILMKYDFLKSGDKLDKKKVADWIKLIHKEKLQHKLPIFSIMRLKEDGIPYLDFDNETSNIILKKEMEMRNGYMDMPSGRQSFLN